MNKERGYLMFYDWMPAIADLTAKDFKTLIIAIWQYQEFGTPPPEFSKKAKALATFIFPLIERRKYLAAIGKKGAEVRFGDSEATTKKSRRDSSLANGIANSIANSSANDKNDSEPFALVKEENKSQSFYKRALEKEQDAIWGDSSSSARNGEIGSADALDKKEGDAVAPRVEKSACGAQKRCGFGTYSNVYLSVEEYLALRRKIKCADAYIDRFSEKLRINGYRYHSHYKAISMWWERDRKLGGLGVVPVSDPEPSDGGSFDTDEFFAAAVRRSLGEDALVDGEGVGGE